MRSKMRCVPDLTISGRTGEVSPGVPSLSQSVHGTSGVSNSSPGWAGQQQYQRHLDIFFLILGRMRNSGG